MLPSKRHQKASDKNEQLSFETQAAHISHIHSLLFQQLSNICQNLFQLDKEL